MQRLIANLIHHKIQKWRDNPKQIQDKVFRKLVKNLSKTKFGKDHNITKNMTIEAFQTHVPIYQYEDYEKKYIPLVVEGEKNILWPGKIKYICQSSGTTSGKKLIPNHWYALYSIIKISFMMGFIFMKEVKDFTIFRRKIFHLYGLSHTKIINGVTYGFVGQLANSLIPDFLVKSKYPPSKGAHYDSWSEKVEAISEDITKHDISVFSGTPPWMNTVLEAFNNKHENKFSHYFSHLKLYVYGGCDFENYRNHFFSLLGKKNDLYTMEVFPASEGYIAFQDHWDHDDRTKKQDMLLNIGSNIFFEFLPYKNGEYDKNKRLLINDLEIGEIYTLVLSTMGCFITYIIGDNIEVTSLKPLRIKFAGRSKQNVNLVNEHMDFRTIQNIFTNLSIDFNYSLTDYVLLPKIENGRALYHWIFAVTENSDNLKISEDLLKSKLNKYCLKLNHYYESWYQAGVILPEQITLVKRDSFINYLEKNNSVGQNKVPNVILEFNSQSNLLDFLTNNNLII